jgi:hypothetical protein
MARLHRRYRHRKNRRSGSDPAPRHNPPLMSDLVEWVIPGFAGFAASRFITRVAATQLAKKRPSWGKHAGVGMSVVTFLAAWYLGHRVKAIAKYHTPITVGSAIAALQSVLQLYLPKLGWMVSDASPELEAGAAVSQLAAPSMNLQPVNDPDFDPNEYTYNDSFDPGRYGAPATSGPGGPAAQVEISDLAVDDAIGQSQNLGVFTNN